MSIRLIRSGISAGVLWLIVIIICVYRWKRWVASRSIAFISFAFTRVLPLGLVHCTIDSWDVWMSHWCASSTLTIVLACGVNRCVTIRLCILVRVFSSISLFRLPVRYFARVSLYWSITDALRCFDPLPTRCVSDALHLCEGESLIYFVSFIDSLLYSCFDCIDPLPTRCVFVRFDPLPTLCVSAALHLCEGGSLIYFVSFIDSLFYSCFDFYRSITDALRIHSFSIRYRRFAYPFVSIRYRRFAYSFVLSALRDHRHYPFSINHYLFLILLIGCP